MLLLINKELENTVELAEGVKLWPSPTIKLNVPAVVSVLILVSVLAVNALKADIFTPLQLDPVIPKISDRKELESA